MNIITLIRDGVTYVKKHPQLVFTFLLVIAIPFAFLLSGQQFLKASKDNQERLEKDRIGLMHDVFASFLTAASYDPEAIQREINTLSELNPDITMFRVAEETPEGVVPIAALDQSVVGELQTNPEAYRIAQIHRGESIIAPYHEYGVRYWQSFRHLQLDDGRVFYIFTETSLGSIDTLFENRVREAYYWLFGLLAIVLLLLIRHIRLIDYGYLYRETKKANEMKDLFTNMIAHELRAPLTAIRGYASLISENEGLENPIRKQGERIEESSNRLIVIVNDLLDVARIQSGKLSVENQKFDLSDVILSVTDALRSSADEKGIKLTSEGTKTPTNMTGDAKRMHQALTNLVSNAIKYTPKGTITVSVEEKKDRVELRVKDTGMGIDAENQKELFAPFFRVANNDVSRITGTGLGMWITKQLIELMGGSVGVESIKGVGTHVVVIFSKK